MPIGEYINFLCDMHEKDLDNRIYMQWTALLPYMHCGYLKYMNYTEYKEAVLGKNLDLRDTDVIVEEIHALFGKE